MGYVLKTASLAAGGEATPISGDPAEIATQDEIVEIAVVGSAAGLTADVVSGADTLALNTSISTANRTPLYPDDYNLKDARVKGDRLIVRVRNPTAGALTYWVAVMTKMAGL